MTGSLWTRELARSARGRGSGGFVLLGGVVLAVVLLASPVGATRPPLAHKAPFVGASDVIRRDADRFHGTLPCHSAIVRTVPGGFNLTTGRAVENVTVTSSCPHNKGTGIGATYRVVLGLRGFPFTVKTTGSHNLTASWNLSYSVYTKAVSRDGYELGEVTGSISAFLVDTSTGKNVTGFFSIQSVISGRSYCPSFCYGTWGGGWNSALPISAGLQGATLLAGHKYQIVTVLTIIVTSLSHISGAGTGVAGGYASASVNLTSLSGVGTYLDSIVVS